MSPLQFLAWLAQTITFTGVAFNVLVLPIAFFVADDAAWLFLGTIPLTIGAGFIWLVLHMLSSVVIENNTSRLGWSLILGWIVIHITVYLINIRDPYDALIPMMYFNVFYLVISSILLFVFRNPVQVAVEVPRPRLFRLDVQIALSVGLAIILMTLLIVR